MVSMKMGIKGWWWRWRDRDALIYSIRLVLAEMKEYSQSRTHNQADSHILRTRFDHFPFLASASRFYRSVSVDPYIWSITRLGPDVF